MDVGDQDARIADLKERFDFARGARWAAEEHLAWIIGAETGFLVGIYFHRWWLGILAGVAAFFLVARYFGRREEAAEDAYNRATSQGKYFRGEPPRDPDVQGGRT